MNDSISEQCLYIESENEDGEKVFNKLGDDTNDSDPSSYSNDNPSKKAANLVLSTPHGLKVIAGGVIASILVSICLFWVGLVDGVGFQGKETTLNLSTLPVDVDLYGFCYSGHAVFPNIYISMEKPSQFPAVLLTSFGICTVLYAGVVVMGYIMFGESTESQFTLNMPQDLVASKIVVWTMVW